MHVRQICAFSDVLAGYDYAVHLSASDWAWEFLRRNGRFQENARAQAPDIASEAVDAQTTCLTLLRRDRLAEAWGLIFFPNPDLTARTTDVFWSDRAFPRKIALLGRERATDEPDELFDEALAAGHRTHLTDARQREHLLIRAGRGALQVRYRGQPLFAGHPLKCDVSLPSISRAGAQADIVSEARRLFGTDTVGVPGLTQKTLRLRNALVTLDAHTAGLTYRETAMILHGEERVSEAWRHDPAPMKSSMARLLRTGQRLCNGGYFRLMANHRLANRHARSD